MNVCLIVHKYGIPLDDPCCYPLGFMYVSAMFKSIGVTVKVLNYNLYEYDLDRELDKQDMVLFTGFEEFYTLIKEQANICRSRGIKTVLGGALATYDTQRMKQVVDEVYLGELGSNFYIDNIPWPDYSGFGIEEYHKRHVAKYMGILTSRGCPFSCSFCSSICRYRERSLVKVEDEIKYYINTYKVDYIVFNDNTLNVQKSRFMEICKIAKRNRVSWSAAIRLDRLDDEMVKAAKESQCNYLVVGVESFIQSKLDKMNKRIKVEQIIQSLDLLYKYNIDYHGNILVGFEGETQKDIEYELSSIPKGYNVFPSFVRPFIGTKEGSIRSISDNQYTKLNKDFLSYIQSKGKYCYPELVKYD